jgi:hypothetical protein
LNAREDFAEVPRFSYAKTSSKAIDRCAPTVVRGWCIGMGHTNVTPIQQALRKRRRKRVSSAISVVLAA